MGAPSGFPTIKGSGADDRHYTNSRRLVLPSRAGQVVVHRQPLGIVMSGGTADGLPDSTFQCAAAKASWMLLAMRPRADTAYPFCLAQSRIAWT